MHLGSAAFQRYFRKTIPKLIDWKHSFRTNPATLGLSNPPHKWFLSVKFHIKGVDGEEHEETIVCSWQWPTQGLSFVLCSRGFKAIQRDYPMIPGKISLRRLITLLLGSRTRITIGQQDTRLLCHKDSRVCEGRPISEGGQEGRRVGG